MSSQSHMRVAGVSFRQGEVRACQVNDEIKFEREPDNPYDQLAIKVIAVGADGTERHVGYVPRTCQVNLRNAIDRTDYLGARIALLGEPEGVDKPAIGIRTVLYFRDENPAKIYPQQWQQANEDPEIDWTSSFYD